LLGSFGEGGRKQLPGVIGNCWWVGGAWVGGLAHRYLLYGKAISTLTWSYAN
jgi:hypothetical protein